MSFSKLKSARQGKVLHSFIKHIDISTSMSETPPDDVVKPNSRSGPDNVIVQDSNTRSQVGSTATVLNTHTVADEETDVDLEHLEHPTNAPQQSNTHAKTKPVPLQGCHSALPSSIEIRESSRHGRGMYTKNKVAAGTAIMSTTPHVSVVSTANLDQYCSACCGLAPESGLKQCQKCKTLRYCNAQCQNKDWIWHKRECSALRKWGASAPSSDTAVPSEAVRCLGRILWGSQKEGLDSSWAKEIRMLHSNRTSLQPSAFESHTHLAHSVVRYLGVSSPQELEPYGLTSAGDLVDLISRFTSNTFTLTTPALTPIGICVSPTVAFGNHSCEPNAVIVFPRTFNAPENNNKEPVLHLVALRDIAVGKEVCISYIDTTLPRPYRQKELQDVYSFTCQCKLCTRVQSADPREALWCPKACGGICPHPTEENVRTRCAKCGTQISDADAILDVLRVGSEASDKAASLQFKDPAKAKQLTTNVIPILTSAGVTPSSHPLLAMTRLHQELLVASMASSLSQDLLDETVCTSAKYSAGLQTILPKGHPVRAVALGELGKLLAVDEPAPPVASETPTAGHFPPSGAARIKLAYEALVKAHEELLVGFGKADGGGQLGKEIRDAIVGLEKELGVWTSGIRNALEDMVMVPGGVGSPSK